MFKDEYKAAFSKVTASEDTYRRVMNMANERKRRGVTGVISKVLIAAVLISLLSVTASASESVRNWFVNFFSDEGKETLSQGQVEFIEENEQYIGESQAQGEWTIELRSALTDGIKGYIMLGVTAPEDISLEDIPQKAKTEYYGPGNDFLPKSPDAGLSSSAYPDFYGVLANIGSSWQEDGDGLKNTVNYVIDVAPDVEWASSDPFGSDTQWHIHIENLVRGFPEQTILAEGTWDFDFTFVNHSEEMQLLKEPIKTQAWAFLSDGSEIQTDVTITSMVLRPFGVTVYYGDASDEVDYERTSISFTDSNAGRSPWILVMKDGVKMELYHAGGNPIERYQFLEAELPIVTDNADYILLSDGTQIPIP